MNEKDVELIPFANYELTFLVGMKSAKKNEATIDENFKTQKKTTCYNSKNILKNN